MTNDVCDAVVRCDYHSAEHGEREAAHHLERVRYE